MIGLAVVYTQEEEWVGGRGRMEPPPQPRGEKSNQSRLEIQPEWFLPET